MLHGFGVRKAFSGNIESGSVIGARSYPSQPQRHVDPIFKIHHLEGSKALVVIHGDYDIDFFLQSSVENRVRGNGALDVFVKLFRFFNRGRDDVDLLRADLSLFAAMGVQRGNRYTRGILPGDQLAAIDSLLQGINYQFCIKFCGNFF